MSQHYFSTTYRGQPVTVVVGYDRPLRGFFCCVEFDEPGEDGDQFVYSNLDDAKLIAGGGFSQSLKYFEKRLADLGLAVPRSLFDESERDRAGNVGNRTVRHQADGSFA